MLFSKDSFLSLLLFSGLALKANAGKLNPFDDDPPEEEATIPVDNNSGSGIGGNTAPKIHYCPGDEGARYSTQETLSTKHQISTNGF